MRIELPDSVSVKPHRVRESALLGQIGSLRDQRRPPGDFSALARRGALGLRLTPPGATLRPRGIHNPRRTCDWDDETYSKVAPVVALNGLASTGLAKMLRDQVQRALKLAAKEEHKKRLRDCLNNINQLTP